RNNLRNLIRTRGGEQIDKVTLELLFGGVRGVESMIWETSSLDPVGGIKFRGNSIPVLREKLPRINGSTEPLPEGLFWLMLVGEIPDESQVRWLSDEWERRSSIPEHTFRLLDTMPPDTHPMTQFA